MSLKPATDVTGAHVNLLIASDSGARARWVEPVLGALTIVNHDVRMEPLTPVGGIGTRRARPMLVPFFDPLLFLARRWPIRPTVDRAPVGCRAVGKPPFAWDWPRPTDPQLALCGLRSTRSTGAPMEIR
jgi:hypothetical protein